MDKNIFNILYNLKKIKYSDKIDKKIYISFYNFFINNYKKYDNINELLNIYIIYNGKENIYNTISFFNIAFNQNIKLDKLFVIEEINRYNNVTKYALSNNKILYFNKQNSYIDFFIIYKKWFDNFIIIKNLNNNKMLKLYIDDTIINYIKINDIFNIKIIKNNKSFWSLINILDFYPSGLKYSMYNDIKEL